METFCLIAPDDGSSTFARPGGFDLELIWVTLLHMHHLMAKAICIDCRFVKRT